LFSGVTRGVFVVKARAAIGMACSAIRRRANFRIAFRGWRGVVKFV